jgi:exosortase/archaeosortase
MKKQLSMVIRIISIPPIMISALITLLFVVEPNIFLRHLDLIISYVCLAVIPILAYPLSSLLPAFRVKGREGQRNLALNLSALGYLSAWVYGLISGCSGKLFLIYTTYFLSVLVLLIFNKVIKLRASGHACGISGPIVFACCFLGVKAIVTGISMYFMILWASLVSKRHTFKEFILGTLTCLISFGLSILILLQRGIFT